MDPGDLRLICNTLINIVRPVGMVVPNVVGGESRIKALIWPNAQHHDDALAKPKPGRRGSRVNNRLKIIGGFMATMRVAVPALAPMMAAQISKPGADFELVEREIP